MSTLSDISRLVTIDRARVQGLLAEAMAHGDTRQVAACRLALAGDEAAARRCAEALAEAEAQDTEKSGAS